jgi:hypothetical protein
MTSCLGTEVIYVSPLTVNLNNNSRPIEESATFHFHVLYKYIFGLMQIMYCVTIESRTA